MGYFKDDGSIASKAIQICAQQAGKPYVWGAGGPDAFDCSGLVHYAFAKAGLPGTGNPTSHSWTTYSMVLMGDAINYGQEQPGDFILPHAGHVGLCIGNGQMWNAPTTGIPVRVDKYGRPFAIRRVTTPSNNSAVGTTPSAGVATPVTDPLSSLGNAVHAFDNAMKWLTDGHNWVRIFELVGGSTLLYIATKVK